MNEKQGRFAAEYIIDLNATQAAIRAGYAPASAYAQGHDLLKHPEVAAEIARLVAERSQRTQIEADRVLTELARMALYDPGDIAKHSLACVADIASLPEDVRRAIVGWKYDKDGRIELKLSPKTPALQLIGQHLQMFRVPVDHGITEGLAKALEKARRRAVEHARQHPDEDRPERAN